MRIAFLGTGRMGTELALQLLGAGHELVAWNRTRERTRIVEKGGARVVDVPEEAVDGADAVVTSLFGPDTVREVVTGPGLVPDGVTWVDTTTVSPADADEFAATVPTYVAAPVVGTLGPARKGLLGVYVGSSDADRRAQVADLVAPWADPDRLVQVGSGREASTGKLLANLALAVSAQGLKEALALGAACGVSEEATLDMLGSTGLAFIAGMKGPFVRGERSTEGGDFTVDAIAKDARLMLDTMGADGADGADLPALRAALESLEVQQRADRGEHDFSAMFVHGDSES
ncbi:NAD(P)-binding domain-containing protein [Brachybacterium halotolerans subsp. kimchii]|uniref:NAD(P)-dependent oxidoreductase n=1 Tax=Brachybacterium halotolerans TaxID=2795215 RepID=UPI001E2F1544|nr:NAD(P)-binding domain-containing protein [Brachybacterium halotolerans subsp. kimchii]